MIKKSLSCSYLVSYKTTNKNELNKVIGCIFELICMIDIAIEQKVLVII